MARRQRTWAEYPRALAMLSSVTFLKDNKKGGAGSVAPNGIGTGIDRIENNRSGGDFNSIGKIEMRMHRSDDLFC